MILESYIRNSENKNIANVENDQHLQCFFDIIVVSKTGGDIHGRTNIV